MVLDEAAMRTFGAPLLEHNSLEQGGEQGGEGGEEGGVLRYWRLHVDCQLERAEGGDGEMVKEIEEEEGDDSHSRSSSTSSSSSCSISSSGGGDDDSGEDGDLFLGLE